MENEHVLGGLTRKRAEIAGNIERQQLALRKLVTELDAIDAAIRIFDPQADISAIKPSHYPRKHAAFRGEMMRFLKCLRNIASDLGKSSSINLWRHLTRPRDLTLAFR